MTPAMSSDQLAGILKKAYTDAGYRWSSQGPMCSPEVVGLVNQVVKDLFETLDVRYIQVVGGD